MKIACITNVSALTPYLSEPLYLQTIAKSMGHSFDLIHVRALLFDKDSIAVQVKTLLEYDLIYYRGGIEEYTASELLRQLSLLGKIIVNYSALSQPLSRSKRYQTVIALNNDIPTPLTILSPLFTKPYSYDAIVATIGSPFISKSSYGSMGQSVFLVDSKESYTSQQHLFTKDCIFQEYLEHDCDYRTLVIGAKVQYILKRFKADNEYRANLKLGGKREIETDPIKIKAISEMSLRAAKMMEYDIAGIDCIWDTKNSRAVFIEANYKPQWQKSAEFFGVNVAREMVLYFESVYNNQP